MARLDLLKLDIEGMELDALAGSDKTIELCRPVILAEANKCGHEKLRAWLEERDYVVKTCGISLLGIHKDDRVLEHWRE